MHETIGFLSVKHHEEHGYFGGYLILNAHARPLEFHCTLPVRPSRAQQLLYGPTFNDFVCGEQIAMALVAKAKLKPPTIFTDCAPVLAICAVSEVDAVQLVFDPSANDEASLLKTPKSNQQLRQVSVDAETFHVLSESSIDEDYLSKLLDRLAPNFEIAEPFQRITEALLEAHPIAKAA